MASPFKYWGVNRVGGQELFAEQFSALVTGTHQRCIKTQAAFRKRVLGNGNPRTHRRIGYLFRPRQLAGPLRHRR
jgi:hypothetical protein